MIYLLGLALIYLIATTVVLLRNRFEFGALKSQAEDPGEYPLVSICIPARNEEAVIERCVASAMKQDYPNLKEA